MSHRIVVSALTVFALLSFGAGCASRPSSGGDVSAPGIPSARSSACDNPYYPLREGYEVVFRNTHEAIGGGTTVDRYSNRVVERTDDMVKLRTSFDGSGTEVEQVLRCVDGSFQASAFVDLATAGRIGQFQVETRRANGDFLPRDVRVGSEWDNSFEIVIHPQGDSPLIQGDIAMNVSIHHRAVGEESVTVPAGSYQALKIETQTTMEGGAFGGFPPVTNHEWWVRGVGLVKTDSSVGAGSAASFVSEAERITLP